MADSDSNAPRARKLSVQLPPADCLLSIAETLDLLAGDDPVERMRRRALLVDSAQRDLLTVRFEDGSEVEPGSLGAQYNMGTHILSADLAALLRRKRWSVTHAGENEAPPAQPSAPPDSGYVPKLDEQEARILEVMRAQGLNPLALVVTPGKSGPKSQVRKECIKNAKDFTPVSFNKAWQRLRDRGAIREAPKYKSR